MPTLVALSPLSTVVESENCFQSKDRTVPWYPHEAQVVEAIKGHNFSMLEPQWMGGEQVWYELFTKNYKSWKFIRLYKIQEMVIPIPIYDHSYGPYHIAQNMREKMTFFKFKR